MEINDQRRASVRYLKEREEKDGSVGKQYSFKAPITQIAVINPKAPETEELFQNPSAKKPYADFEVPEGFENNQLFTNGEFISSLKLNQIGTEAFSKALEDAINEATSAKIDPEELTSIKNDSSILDQSLTFIMKISNWFSDAFAKARQFHKG